MKKNHLCILLIALAGPLLPSQVFAQAPINVIEVREYMSMGEQTGLRINIPNVEPDEVISAWKKFTKEFNAKTKTSRKSIEAFTDDARMPLVSDNTIDIFSIVKKNQYGTEFTAYADLGGAFISSFDHPAAFGAFERHLQEFSKSITLAEVKDELKAQEKVLKELGKDLSSLIKQKDKYLKEIEKAKELIAEKETDIVNNEQAQEIKRRQTALQEEIVETIKAKKGRLKN